MTSTELVPTPSLDFANQDLSAEIEKAKNALASTSDAEAVAEIRDRASVIETAARLVESQRDLFVAAGEVRLRAERRAGEIRSSLPRIANSSRSRPRQFDRQKAKTLRAQGLTLRGVADELHVSVSAIHHAEKSGFPEPSAVPHSALQDFDSRFARVGTSNTTRKSKGLWFERLARIPQDKFEELLDLERTRDDPSFGLITFVKRYNLLGRTRIEPNISRLADGRYVVEVSVGGVSRKKTLDTTSIEEARVQVAKFRGNLKKKTGTVAKNLSDVQADAAKSCRTLDKYILAQPGGSPKRQLANEAYALAMKLEQTMIRLLAIA